MSLRTIFQRFVEGPLSRFAFGPLPPWSNLPHHKVVNTMTANVGASVMCYFTDPETKEVMVILGERPVRGSNSTLINGTGGGFGVLDKKPQSPFYPEEKNKSEQPAEMASRELREEFKYPDGSPVLSIHPDEFKFLFPYVDDRALAKGGLPTACFGYSVEITDAEQIGKIKTHIQKLSDDPGYRDACRKASGDESAMYRIEPLQDAIYFWPGGFAHPHELMGLQKLYSDLQDKPSAEGPAQGLNLA